MTNRQFGLSRAGFAIAAILTALFLLPAVTRAPGKAHLHPSRLWPSQSVLRQVSESHWCQPEAGRRRNGRSL